MRALLWIAAGLALLWAALWGGAHLGLRQLGPALAAHGVTLTQTDRQLSAWPPTLSARWQAPQVSTPRALWQAERLTVDAPLQRPGWVEANLSGHQQLLLSALPIALDAEDLTAALRVRPLPPLPLREARMDMTAGRATVGGIAVGTVAQAGVTVALSPDRPTADVTVGIAGLQPMLTTEAPAIATITLTARADLDRTATVMEYPARLRALTIDALTVDWNGAALTLTGTLSVTPDGLWEGQLILTGTDWTKALDAAVSAGMMEPGIADTWAGLARALGATDDRLDLPLKVSGGQVWLGLLPVAALPQMPPPRP